MKNTFYIASAFAALLAIGCNKSEQPAGTPETPAKESGIVLYAQDINAIGSKTTTTEENGKFTVNWVNGDQLAVYTVPAGTNPTTMTLEEWQKNEPVRFKATESAAQDGSMKFVLNETESEAGRLAAFKERYGAGNLDWYAVYPGIMETASHSGKGMVTFGVSNKSQSGNNNMEHLAKQDVLFGKVLNTKEPVITMQHIGTLMEFTVTNASDTEFTVKSISITAPDVIVGEFRLNLTKETPLDKTDGFNQSGTYTLTVNDATPIGIGENAHFYQILTPFTVAVGQSVSITVNTDKGSWSKSMKAKDNALTFEAGKKYNANLIVNASIKEVTDINLGIGNNAASKYGPYLSLRTGTVYTKDEGSNNCDDIDVAYVYVPKSDQATSNAPKIVAPGDEWTFNAILPSIKTWSARHKTLFKKTDLTIDDCTAVKDAFDLKRIFDEASGVGSTGLSGLTNPNAEGSIISAMTEDGHYALIHYVRVAGWSNEMNESVSLNIKMEK